MSITSGHKIRTWLLRSLPPRWWSETEHHGQTQRAVWSLLDTWLEHHMSLVRNSKRWILNKHFNNKIANMWRTLKKPPGLIVQASLQLRADLKMLKEVSKTAKISSGWHIPLIRHRADVITFTCTMTLQGKTTAWTQRVDGQRCGFRTLQFCPFCKFYKPSADWTISKNSFCKGGWNLWLMWKDCNRQHLTK